MKTFITLSILIISLISFSAAQADNSNSTFLGLADPLNSVDPQTIKGNLDANLTESDQDAIPAIGSIDSDSIESDEGVTYSGDVVVTTASEDAAADDDNVVLPDAVTDVQAASDDNQDFAIDIGADDLAASTSRTATPSVKSTVNSDTVDDDSLSPATTSYTNTVFINACMQYHNIERAAVGVPKISWSPSLAKAATAWSQKMAASSKFAHSKTPHTGENIAETTSSQDTLFRLFRVWMNEKNTFKVGCTFPNCAKTSAEVGHYTQMVWRTTTQVGCGWAQGKSFKYFTCQYLPSGNVLGSKVY